MAHGKARPTASLGARGLKPSLTYEPEQTKAYPLATQTVALLAGEMAAHAVICPAVLEGLRSNPPPGFLVKNIAELYALEFSFHRRYLAEQELLMPHGLNMEEFLRRQKDMSPGFVRDLSDALLNHRLHAEAIIAGVDHTGAHIYKIVDPGVAVSFDTPCFAAIGTGRPHAESHLMTSGFAKSFSMAQTVYAVFSAKMKAEIAAGVGSKTDLMLIRGGMLNPPLAGGAFPAKSNELQKLKALFDEQRAADLEAAARAVVAVEELLNTPAAQNRQPMPTGMQLDDPTIALTAVTATVEVTEDDPTDEFSGPPISPHVAPDC